MTARAFEGTKTLTENEFEACPMCGEEVNITAEPYESLPPDAFGILRQSRDKLNRGR